MRPDDRKYMKSHEWCLIDGDVAAIGISDHAVSQLGDLIHLELPDVGAQVTIGETFGEIESVKSVADIYSPVTGEVVAANEALVDGLEGLGDDAYDAGWMIKVRFTAVSDDLMDAAAYTEQVDSED